MNDLKRRVRRPLIATLVAAVAALAVTALLVNIFTRQQEGYAFATDFREERGHAYMLDDQTFTERQHVAKQPGTCLHCQGLRADEILSYYEGAGFPD
jgi:formate-dependent nitrite reductase cytochrome c552 subunit